MTSSNAPDWSDIFFGAALEPARWLEALDQLANHTGATHGQLIGVGNARDIPFNLLSHFSAADSQEFIDIGGGSPELNFRIAACNERIAKGDYDGIVFEKDYDAAIPLLRSRRYLDFCERVDIPFGCQTNLVIDRGGLVGLATLRTRKDGRTTAPQRRVFAQAASAARRAVRLQERLEGDQALLLAGAFDAIRATAFVLDSQGRVQAMTQGAEHLIAAGRIALRGRHLEADGTPLSLAQGVAALVGYTGLDHLQLRIDHTDPGSPVFLEGFRLPRRGWSLGRLPQAILVAKSPQRDRAGIAAFLGALYRLTATEADIAMRLFDGTGRVEIAMHRQVTAETLRGQIKDICAKTGARNETDLMRVLAAIMS